MEHLQWDAPPKMQIDPNKTYRATMKTTRGTIELELYITIDNFVVINTNIYPIYFVISYNNSNIAFYPFIIH